MADRKELITSWKELMAKEDSPNLIQRKAELEERIIEEIKAGNMLSSYVKVSNDNNQPIEPATVKEMLRLFQLVPDGYYFDISELEDIFYMSYNRAYTNEKFIQICIDLIMNCPVSIKNKEKFYNVQSILFDFGTEEDIWYAYRKKKFYPQEILQDLYVKMKKKSASVHRLVWIVGWMSVSRLSTSEV